MLLDMHLTPVTSRMLIFSTPPAKPTSMTPASGSCGMQLWGKPRDEKTARVALRVALECPPACGEQAQQQGVFRL